MNFLFLLALLSFSTYNGRWEDPTLTHSEPAELAPYVTGAFAEWATAAPIRDAGTGDDVVFEWGDPLGDWGGQSTLMGSETDSTRYVHCTVTLDRAWWDSHGEDARRWLVLHELGHCFGLDHSQGGVMDPAGSYTTIQPDDVAGIRSIYGAMRPIHIALLASD